MIDLTAFLMADEVQENATTVGTTKDVIITQGVLLWDSPKSNSSDSSAESDLKRQREMRKSALAWKRVNKYFIYLLQIRLG